MVVKKIKEKLNNDKIYYFALSHDNYGGFEHEIGIGQKLPEEFPDDFKRMKADEKFTVFENNIRVLFSKNIGVQYLMDKKSDEKVVTKHIKNFQKNSDLSHSQESKEINIPSSYDYYDFPMSKEEYLKAVDKKMYNTVAMLKKIIYETLKSD